MDREAALGYLSELHARALRLACQGRSLADIAEALGIDPHSVGPLLAVASAKLERVLDQPDAGRIER